MGPHRPRPGVGMVECYDPALRSGFIIAETGERRGFWLGRRETWIPQAGDSVVFTRLIDRRGLLASGMKPFPSGARVVGSPSQAPAEARSACLTAYYL
jgi:hypothetical protein